MNATVTIPAATVILVRQPGAGAPEILMMQRGDGLAFAGGALVFPGGRVDAADLVIARDPMLAFGFDNLDDDDAAARVACAREAFEETGVLLTAGPAPDPAALAAARARLAAVSDSCEASTFAALIAALGHRVEAARFLPFAQWVPPAAAPIKRRFDTRFYLADAGRSASDAISPDGSEAVALRWTTAADVLARADAGEAALVFPTKCNLQRLGQYAGIAEIFDAAARRSPPFVQPQIVMRDGETWLTIPADCDYPMLSERMADVRRE